VTYDGAVVCATTLGEIVGELSMLGSGRRSATLRGVEQLRVLVFTPDEIDSVLSAVPSSAQRADPARSSTSRSGVVPAVTMLVARSTASSCQLPRPNSAVIRIEEMSTQITA
jgi:CRP-like cAMP-binding protein